MDIVIRNGVIKQNESQELHEKKNEEKKHISEFEDNKPGPYYDPYDGHLHIYRKPKMIKNFTGPQDPLRIKVDNYDYKQNEIYCAICHKSYKNKFSFLSKKLNSKEIDDYYQPISSLNGKLDKLNNFNSISINSSFSEIKISNLDKFTKMCIEYYNIHKEKELDSQINKIYCEAFSLNCKRNKIYKKYFDFIYKLLNKPLIYMINPMESKLIWEKDFTRYQRFKFNNPNYKKSPVIYNQKTIKENYVMIV